jgi:hypothetical protein
MRRTTLAAAIALAVMSSAGAAWAGPGTDTPRFDARQSRQQERIDAGTASGTLTEREAARLQAGQTHLQNVEDKVKADGDVTAKERVRLEKAADTQSRRIWRQKHDRQHDFNRDGRIDHPARPVRPERPVR